MDLPNPGIKPRSSALQADSLPSEPSRKPFPGSSDDKESACNAEDLDSIPGLGRSCGEGNGYLQQHSCLENSMDRESWQAIQSMGRKELDTTERLIGEGSGTPLQYSCLENPMDGGAWWAAVQRVATE